MGELCPVYMCDRSLPTAFTPSSQSPVQVSSTHKMAQHATRGYNTGSAFTRSRSMMKDGGGSSSYSRMTSQSHDTQDFYANSGRASSESRKSRTSTPALDRTTWLPSPTQNRTNTITFRDPLFSDFVSSLSKSSDSSSVYNSVNMSTMKDQFRNMVQDKWDRSCRGDPAVEHDIALRTSGWSNYLDRSEKTASETLGRKHSHSNMNRVTPPTLMPRITVYHRSTLV